MDLDVTTGLLPAPTDIQIEICDVLKIPFHMDLDVNEGDWGSKISERYIWNKKF